MAKNPLVGILQAFRVVGEKMVSQPKYVPDPHRFPLEAAIRGTLHATKEVAAGAVAVTVVGTAAVAGGAATVNALKTPDTHAGQIDMSSLRKPAAPVAQAPAASTPTAAKPTALKHD